MKALILAAGYAVRLYPLTKQYPKPLLKVGKKNKPIINYIIDKLEAIEAIDEIMVVTNSKYISIFRKWAKNLKCSKKISLIDDLTSTPEDKRGAIGDIAFSVNDRKIKNDLLIIGGDNLFDCCLEEFLVFSKSKVSHPIIGVYDIKDLKQAHKYGVVNVNKEGKITDFKEKPKNPKTTLVAMCLYYFPKNKLKLIKDYLREKTKSDATGFYIDWLRKKETVFGFVFGGRWFDIGCHNFYQKAKEAF